MVVPIKNVSEKLPRVRLEAYFIVGGTFLKKEIMINRPNISRQNILACLEEESQNIQLDMEIETDQVVPVSYTKAVIMEAFLSPDLRAGDEVFNQIVN